MTRLKEQIIENKINCLWSFTLPFESQLYLKMTVVHVIYFKFNDRNYFDTVLC